MVGGAAAIVGSWVIGPRQGRWDPAKHGEFVPHDVKSVLGGVLILWVAWYGFNPGSTAGMSTIEDADQASNAALATTMAGSAGRLTALQRRDSPLHIATPRCMPLRTVTYRYGPQAGWWR